MGAKALIIAEKPSVARDIVSALGRFRSQERGAYWESDEYLCSFAVGHLLTLLEPHEIDPKWKRWSFSQLPMLPRRMPLKPVKGGEGRIEILRRLAERDDVDRIINACDAAREGELIFREIIAYLRCRKTVQRLWLQSMTPEAIRSGFSKLRDGRELKGLAAAAVCRAKADWLIGLNASRAFSLRLKGAGARGPWSVGRVQTPTLAILVRREREIREHVSRPFWRVKARFESRGSAYEGTFFDPSFSARASEPHAKDDRIFDSEKAASIAAEVENQPARARDERDERRRRAPSLFSLPELQKTMSRHYKWGSERTLAAAQRAYETHKVLTYPRTDSVFLPSDYREEVERLVGVLAEEGDFADSAGRLRAQGLSQTERHFNDAGVKDHFAIIPTGRIVPLSGDDAKLFDVVCKRFLAAFYPDALYDRVKRITRVGERAFRTGPYEVIREPGWQTVYGKAAGDPVSGASHEKLPPLPEGESGELPCTSARTVEDATRPPPRITEARLLSLMENAGREVEDEELATALKSAEGLGTAATRAEIIQNLKRKGYVDESLRPTEKGMQLITLLEGAADEERPGLTSPALTARMELHLAEVEAGQRQATAFVEEVESYASQVVETARQLDGKAMTAAFTQQNGTPHSRERPRESERS